jgi:hypothetical protein
MMTNLKNTYKSYTSVLYYKAQYSSTGSGNTVTQTEAQFSGFNKLLHFF